MKSGTIISGCFAAAFALVNGYAVADDWRGPPPGGFTATPIKHLVVIFQENISYDHYSAPIRAR